MLFSGGAHRDDAVLRIGDDRSRLAERAALGDGHVAFFYADRIGTVFNPAFGGGFFCAAGGLNSGARAAGRAGLLHRSLAGARWQYLIGLVQNIFDVLRQRFPEVIFGYIFDAQ